MVPVVAAAAAAATLAATQAPRQAMAASLGHDQAAVSWTGTTAGTAGTAGMTAYIIQTRHVMARLATRAARPANPAPRPSRRRRQTTAAAPAQGSGGTALDCTGTAGMLPENYATIVSFLVSNGYSHNAAFGIAGNIYQESGGNPESVGTGGGGLIGWTPLPDGYVTGNPEADLQTQLAAILTFNDQWSAYIPALNAASTPADAALIYVTYFERAGIPAAANREDSAEAVAQACGS